LRRALRAEIKRYKNLTVPVLASRYARLPLELSAIVQIGLNRGTCEIRGKNIPRFLEHGLRFVFVAR